jgi:hypothetical protein
VVASLGSGSFSDDAAYAPGVQKSKVSGSVFRWHQESGLQAVPAVEYIESLEEEIALLKKQVWPPF